jgi:hypothetical protein
MKAVLRLIYTYFTCTPVQKTFSAIGIGLIAIAYVVLRMQPLSFFVGMLVLAGVASTFIGSAMMPLTLGRMARSHMAKLIPGARIKLLASALLTLLLVALPTPSLFVMSMLVSLGPPHIHPTAAQIAQFHLGIIQTFWSSYATVTLFAAWLYVALWFITRKRNAVGFLQGLIVIAAVLLVPTRHIVEPNVQMWWDLTQCGLTLAGFSVLFLIWPQLRHAVGKLRLDRVFGYQAGRSSRVRGREIDLLLGTSNPWLLAFGQLVPVLLAARIGYYSAAVWLFYLTIFSTVAGAIAGRAAERSRTLWLRGDWSRAQLFSQVERSFWRHNNYVLAILLILMVGIGSYAGLPVKLLATGVVLLILATVLSTYLGLMLTRGLRLAEAVLAVAVMMALMAVAILAARNSDDVATVLGLELLLALAAWALRNVARSRWARIDWMQCRADRALSGRSAA